MEFSATTHDPGTNTGVFPFFIHNSGDLKEYMILVVTLLHCITDSESAEVHCSILHDIHSVVLHDTGRDLCFDYIYHEIEAHSLSLLVLPRAPGIQLIVADQGLGQALGNFIDFCIYDIL
jgi:hypothetical protein